MFNWDAPLLAVHILWVNLATATLPALALGVDPDVAAKDACKVEHDLSEETYSKMIAFAEKAEKEL